LPPPFPFGGPPFRRAPFVAAMLGTGGAAPSCGFRLGPKCA